MTLDLILTWDPPPPGPHPSLSSRGVEILGSGSVTEARDLSTIGLSVTVTFLGPHNDVYGNSVCRGRSVSRCRRPVSPTVSWSDPPEPKDDDKRVKTRTGPRGLDSGRRESSCPEWDEDPPCVTGLLVQSTTVPGIRSRLRFLGGVGGGGREGRGRRK